MKLTSSQYRALYEALVVNKGRVPPMIDMRIVKALLDKGYTDYSKGYKDSEQDCGRNRVTQQGYVAAYTHASTTERLLLSAAWYQLHNDVTEKPCATVDAVRLFLYTDKLKSAIRVFYADTHTAIRARWVHEWGKIEFIASETDALIRMQMSMNGQTVTRTLPTDQAYLVRAAMEEMAAMFDTLQKDLE